MCGCNMQVKHKKFNLQSRFFFSEMTDFLKKESFHFIWIDTAHHLLGVCIPQGSKKVPWTKIGTFLASHLADFW